MLSLLTNSILDIGFGVFYWVGKKSIAGVYNGVNYIFFTDDGEETECSLKNENDYILMTDFRNMLQKKNEEINVLRKEIDQLKGQ
jgi:hypothetical protein